MPGTPEAHIMLSPGFGSGPPVFPVTAPWGHRHPDGKCSRQSLSRCLGAHGGSPAPPERWIPALASEWRAWPTCANTHSHTCTHTYTCSDSDSLSPGHWQAPSPSWEAGLRTQSRAGAHLPSEPQLHPKPGPYLAHRVVGETESPNLSHQAYEPKDGF